MTAIQMERIRLLGKRSDLLVVKATLALMLLAISFLASGSVVHADDGEFIWAKSIGRAGTDQGLGIPVDGRGNVHIIGQFQETVDFDSRPGAFNLTSSGGSDVFVFALNSNGDFVWAKSMGGTIDRLGYGIAVDGGEKARKNRPYKKSQLNARAPASAGLFFAALGQNAAIAVPSSGREVRRRKSPETFPPRG